jgi:hypothetical protein
MASLQCQFCGAAITLSEPFGRDSTCESCRHDLRCCRQCRHYDPSYHGSCREPHADLVEDKTRGNFCEFFYFSRSAFQPASTDRSREDAARARLAALFGGGSDPGASGGRAAPGGPGAGGGKSGPGAPLSPQSRADEARRKLENLFGKKKTEGE